MSLVYHFFGTRCTILLLSMRSIFARRMIAQQNVSRRLASWRDPFSRQSWTVGYAGSSAEQLCTTAPLTSPMGLSCLAADVFSLFQREISEVLRPIAVKLCHAIGNECKLRTSPRIWEPSCENGVSTKRPKFGAISDNFARRSEMYPQRIKMSTIGK